MKKSMTIEKIAKSIAEEEFCYETTEADLRLLADQADVTDKQALVERLQKELELYKYRLKNCIDLYHTSRDPITEIHSDGPFGSALCFAAEPYCCDPSGLRYVYRIWLEKSEVLECCHLCYLEQEEFELVLPIVKELEAEGFAEDEAWELLGELTDLFKLDRYDPDLSWRIQRMQADCAKALGKKAIETTDEQGTMWLVHARIEDLEFVGTWD